MNKNINTNMVQQIKASAGSGKTHTIINTLLNLFSQNNADLKQVFSSILAITFTNSAASDMKSKLISRLKNIALDIGAPDANISMKKDEAIKCIQGFIANYTSLNIRTIDSFLFMLLRQSTLNLHLPPNVEPLFDSKDFFVPLLDELALLSLHKDLEFSQEDEANSASAQMAILLQAQYAAMYKAIFYNEPQKGFLGLDKIRSKILVTLNALEKLRAEEKASLTDFDKLHEIYQESLAVYGSKLEALQKIIDDNSLKTIKEYRDSFDAFQASKKVSSFFEKDEDILYEKTLFSTSRKSIEKTGNDTLRVSIISALRAIRAAYELPYLLSSAEKFSPLITFCRIILEMQEYEEFNKGKIISERIPKVLKELIESEDALLPLLLEQLPYELESVLIDEFQDTSNAQWDIIRAFSEDTLSRGGSLTYVGDVKQAIYSWRGGNSFLFEGILSELKAEIKRTNLDTNWRSSKDVIEFNNFIFEQFKDVSFSQEIEELLIIDDCIGKSNFAKELSTLFDDVAQKVSEKNQNSLNGKVLLYDVQVEHSGRGKVPNEAIYTAVKKRLCDAIADSHNRYDYKDMAILVRKNAHCELCATWLTEAGVPVITEGALNLSANILVTQLISLLEYLKDSDNEIALWHICAFKGLFSDDYDLIDEEKLLAYRLSVHPNGYIIKKSKREEYGNLVEKCLAEKSPKLSELLAEYAESSKKINTYSLLSKVVEDCKLFERFKSQSGFIASLLELTLKAQNNGINTIHSFLEYWYEKGHEEKIPMPEGIDAVRILTVHKSKGAEFDVCFVWNDIAKPRKPDGLKFYNKNNLSFFAKHSIFHEDYIKDAKIQAIEAINLLYVAFTRAKNELHIFYRETNKQNSILERILDKALAKSKQSKKFNAYLFSENTVANYTKAKNIEEDASQIEAILSMQYRMPSLNFEELQESKVSVLTANMRGKIIHNCFEHYFKLCKLDRDCDKKIVPTILNNTLLHAPEKMNLMAELENSFTWLKGLADWEGWLQQDIISEQNLLDANGNLLRCDLCLVSDNTLHIIDFKTGSEDKSYQNQLIKYIKALKGVAMYKNYNISASLLYIDKQKIQAIDYEE